MPERKVYWREMLDYEWGNPSTMILSGEEPVPVPEHNSDTSHLLTHYATDHQPTFIDQNTANNLLSTHQNYQQPAFSHHHFVSPHQLTQSQHLHSLYDPRADPGASHYASHPFLSMDHVATAAAGGASNGFLLVPKNEEAVNNVSRAPSLDFVSRIGLNLGGRTYFSSSEDDFVSRLYRRSRIAEPGSSNSPRCQAEGCNADMTHAKHYHRRHKVCEFHSKASTVIAAGLTQRFCQQCSRFHLLAEFDNGKRSCRKRLADHNRRRRKTQQPVPENPKLHFDNASSSDHNLARSPAESGSHSSSSVTIAVSPPQISLDCFRLRGYQATPSSGSSSPLFFSCG